VYIESAMSHSMGAHTEALCIANCGQTVPDTTVVCIDSLREHITALPNSIILDV